MTWFDASFGSSKTGLVTVGVEEYDITGAVTVARTTTGVVELEGGGYGRNWTLNASTISLVWDTGEGTPIYAIEDTKDIWAQALTEGYPADGVSSVTPTQLLYSVNQMLSEFARTGVLVSVKERDGVTEAFEITLDSGTVPTTATQSS